VGKPGVPAIVELLHRRVSVERFDPARGLSDSEVRDLVADAIQAPSSFNIQHWRFVAVRHAQDKRRLQEAAFDQPQVGEAAVTFIVLGDLRGLERLEAALEQAIERGALPRRKAEAWVRMAREIYADPQQNRDEVIRSCSLAAMALMLSAEARGLVSAPLSGFDGERVRREFEIGERFLPVMLLSVGHPAAVGERRKPRLGVDEVLAFDRARDF
jgi:nitroreductase